MDPWFSTDRLLDLAAVLPSTSVEYNLGDLPVSQPGSTIPASGLTLEETIRNIDRCGSWVLLKSVEQHPDYEELQRLCLAEIAGELDLSDEELLAPRSFVFLSSPEAVTPFHIDPEHNFLLQIQGSKEIQIFDHFDRTALGEERHIRIHLVQPELRDRENEGHTVVVRRRRCLPRLPSRHYEDHCLRGRSRRPRWDREQLCLEQTF